MSDLIFNPEKGNLGGEKYYGQDPQKSKFAEFIIRLSGGKLDEQKANYIMVGIFAAIIIATVVVFYFTFAGNRPSKNIQAVPNEAGQNVIPISR